jgi:peptide/nickel transport system permease protein
LTQESGWRERYATTRYHLRKNPLVLLGAIVVLAWILIALGVLIFDPANPLKQEVSNRMQSPNGAHLLGTDELGRDLFVRVLYGAKVTMPAGLAVVAFGSIIGTLIGSISGYLGGRWDELFMRITELFMAFPVIILALAITAALGPNIRNAVIALTVAWWPNYARLVRSLVLEIKSKEYVEAAHSVGAGNIHIIFRTILPNCVAPALVLATLDIGNAILAIAGLSFLGLGPDPSSPEWGRMVSNGVNSFDYWWTWLYPGLAIASLVMAFNFIGDGLRDIFDPRLRR